MLAAAASPPPPPPPAPVSGAAADTRLSRTELKEQIFNKLKSNEVEKVVLYGKAGVGKTWMARELSIQAVVEDLVHVVLWVYLSRTYDKCSLYKSIACQLSQSLDIKKEKKSPSLDPANNDMERESLKRYVVELLEKKECLLVLDDEGNKMLESRTMDMLEDVVKPSKVLITRDDYNNCQDIAFEIKPLTEDESIALLKDRAGPKVASFLDSDHLSKAIGDTCKNLPAAIIFTAAALRHIEHESDAFVVDCALKEVVQVKKYWELWSGFKMLRDSSMINCFWLSRQYLERHKSINYNELISYWIMEGCVGKFNSLKKAYDKGHAILMDLIDAGLLGQREAGDIVMETAGDNFADFHAETWGKSELGLSRTSEDSWNGLGKLIHQEGRIEARRNNGKDLLTLLVDGKDLSRMDQSNVQELQVLYIYSPIFKCLRQLFPYMKELRVLVLRDCKLLNEDDVECIASLTELTALEISGPGSKKLEKFPPDFFKNFTKLEVLNLTGLHIISLPSTEALTELRWLILRRCTQLTELGSLNTSKKLEVLDLSGATEFKKFKDESFHENLNLQVLDLSETKVTKFPVVKKLQQLTHFLLRGCSELKMIRQIHSDASLRVIDFSGCSMIQKISEDELSSGVISLNLSGTAIDTLPSKKMSNLQYLCLKGCKKLNKMSRQNISEKLKILDLSDCSALTKFEKEGEKKVECELDNDFFKDLNCLLELNLSNTRLSKLPTSLCNLCNLRKLILRECVFVSSKSLAKMEGLTSLHMLDLSDCAQLTAIPENLFSLMPQLLKLDLSNTGIVELGNAFSFQNHLSCLLLTGCSKLAKLPPKSSLGKLKELNLSGASSLNELPADFFEPMTDLQILDLSRTSIGQLPPLSEIKRLRRLFLSDCSNLKKVPNLKNPEKLEVLDLSGTGVEGNLSLVSMTNLCELLLRGCSSLKGLTLPQSLHRLEILDLHGTDIQEFPDNIMELSMRVKRIDLPDKLDMGNIDWSKITITTLPEEMYHKGQKKDFLELLKF